MELYNTHPINSSTIKEGFQPKTSYNFLLSNAVTGGIFIWDRKNIFYSLFEGLYATRISQENDFYIAIYRQKNARFANRIPERVLFLKYLIPWTFNTFDSQNLTSFPLGYPSMSPSGEKSHIF